MPAGTAAHLDSSFLSCIPLEATLAHLHLANKPAWALEEMEAIYSKLFN